MSKSRYFADTQDSQSNAPYTAMAHVLEPIITGQKQTGLGSRLVALESYSNPETASEIRNALTANLNNVASAMAAVSVESFDEAPSNPTQAKMMARSAIMRKRAGAIALEACSDPVAYMNNRAISNESASATFDFTTGARAISLGIQPNAVSTESFEYNALNAAMPYSVSWNVACASQDEFSETFFPTVVVGPDQIGFIAEIRVQTVYAGMRHRRADEVNPEEKRLLQDAYQDSTILRHEAIKLVPYFPKDLTGENAYLKEYFADEAKIAPTEVLISNVPVRTNPLRFGKSLNLLAISSVPALLANNTFDETDQLDVAVGLRDIYIEIGAGAQPVKFKTQGLVRAQFQRPQEGYERGTQLDFDATEFVLSAETVDVSGNPIPEVAALAAVDYSARLRVWVTARINHNNSTLETNVPQISVVEVINNLTGDRIDPKSPAVKSLVDALTFGDSYFDLNANRTNSNFRTQGPIIDSDAWTEKYILGLRSPITLQKPIGQDRDYPATENLISATRIRQTHDAMYELLTYRDTLAEWVNLPANKATESKGRRIPNFIGLGKYCVRPWYDHITIDLQKSLNTTRSAFKLEDARAHVMTVIQEAVARMYTESNYYIALQLDGEGKAQKPHVAIGTDPYFTMLLSLQGDNRLLGQNYDYTVAMSVVNEMRNKMFVTFTRPDKKEYDHLTFGNTLYCPELITTVTPYAHNGAIKNITQVSPRYQHVPNLPILLEIDIINATEILQQIVKYHVVTEPATLTTSPAVSTASTGSASTTAGAGSASMTASSTGSASSKPASSSTGSAGSTSGSTPSGRS